MFTFHFCDQKRKVNTPSIITSKKGGSMKRNLVKKLLLGCLFISLGATTFAKNQGIHPIIIQVNSKSTPPFSIWCEVGDQKVFLPKKLDATKGTAQKILTNNLDVSEFCSRPRSQRPPGGGVCMITGQAEYKFIYRTKIIFSCSTLKIRAQTITINVEGNQQKLPLSITASTN